MAALSAAILTRYGVGTEVGIRQAAEEGQWGYPSVPTSTFRRNAGEQLSL
jgi:hypothetical protein